MLKLNPFVRITLLSMALFLTSCAYFRKLPEENYYEYAFDPEVSYSNDTLSFNLKNPLKCPIRLKIKSVFENKDSEKILNKIVLGESKDTLINIYYPDLAENEKLRIVRYRGDLNKEILKNKIAYPFPKGKGYSVIQGYEGKFTHNTKKSRYAIDFDLQIGDTITCADDGYVVGLIEDYKEFGLNKKWRNNDKSNFITLYHPHSGLFTQYVHLDYKGALVKLGDFVEKHQAIAISGMTGYTTTPHLHFNVKIPSKEDGYTSTTIEFDSDVKGSDLKNKDKIKILNQ